MKGITRHWWFQGFFKISTLLSRKDPFSTFDFPNGWWKTSYSERWWILATFFVTHLQFPLKPPSPTNRCFPAEMPRRKRLTFSPTEDIISNLRCLQRVLISIKNPCLEIFWVDRRWLKGKELQEMTPWYSGWVWNVWNSWNHGWPHWHLLEASVDE